MSAQLLDRVRMVIAADIIDGATSHEIAEHVLSDDELVDALRIVSALEQVSPMLAACVRAVAAAIDAGEMPA